VSPVTTAYNQWTQFEDFCNLGPVGERKSSSVMTGGVACRHRRRTPSLATENLGTGADQRVAWAANEGATNVGAVEFEDVSGGQTRVNLTLEYEPEARSKM
jgi:uncharacterized membrane protein